MTTRWGRASSGFAAVVGWELIARRWSEVVGALVLSLVCAVVDHVRGGSSGLDDGTL